MRKIKWSPILITTSAIIFALIIGCSNNSSNPRLNTKDSTFSQEDLSIRNQAMVSDNSGNPIAHANVSIGDEISTSTDDKGIFNIPADWKDELPVTITKAGYIKTSYLHQRPNGQTFIVRPLQSAIRHEVKGSVTGFGNLPKDGYIDFALALTSLTNKEALNFDISKLISEESDTINVMGQELDIPTNVFLPNQRESYSFIPVTIEKAFYRLFYDFKGTYQVQTNRGKFDFKKVADKLKSGKSFFEVVNDFQFLSLGTKTVKVDANHVSLDLDGNQKALAPKVNFTTPVPQTGMLFGVSMLEENNKLIPSDIKLREGHSQQLALPQSSTGGKILLIHADKVQINKDEAKLSNSMSTALVDSAFLNDGFILDRVSPPVMTSDSIKLSKPILKGNLKGFATYAALSRVKEERFKSFTLERTDIAWEIYSPGWIDEISLPDISDVSRGQRWEVVFYGSDSLTSKQFNGPDTLNNATHAVQNAVEF